LANPFRHFPSGSNPKQLKSLLEAERRMPAALPIHSRILTAKNAKNTEKRNR
jgi:hypothetical protein